MFRKELLEAFLWIQYEEDKVAMLCKYCKEPGVYLAELDTFK